MLAVAATSSALVASLPSVASAVTEVIPRPSSGVFQMVGHGVGPGRGLSQYGALIAAQRGLGYRDILEFYFPANRVRSQPESEVRVRIAATAARLSWPQRHRLRAEVALQAPDGPTDTEGVHRHVRRPTACTRSPDQWRVQPHVELGLRVEARCGGSWRPARPLGAALASLDLRNERKPSTEGVAVDMLEAGTRARVALPGTVEVRPSTTAGTPGPNNRLQVINAVATSDYVAAVLGQVMPTWWPSESLRAQATVLRSHLTRLVRHSDAGWDVEADGRWAYRGIRTLNPSWKPVTRLRSASATAAAASTRTVVLKRGSRVPPVSWTQSNGGLSAPGPGSPAPRLDAWDLAAYQNTRRSWTGTVRARELQAARPKIGRLLEVRVPARSGGGPWGGRVTSLELVGKDGTATVKRKAVPKLLGVPSGYVRLRDPDLGGWITPVQPAIWGAEFARAGSLWSLGYHTGQDFPAPFRTPVLAGSAGRVVEIGTSGPYGLHVVLEHPDGVRTRYAHLNEVVVARGKEVEAGQLIGGVGSTGNSTGAHLHLEVLVDGIVADPEPLLRGDPVGRPAQPAVNRRLADRPLMTAGSVGDRVKRVQLALKVDPSGYLGSATQARLRTFQRNRDLATTGTTTPRTWRAIESKLDRLKDPR